MKHETLEQALNEISDRHIAEAAAPKKARRTLPIVSAVAALLALAILLSAVLHSQHSVPSLQTPTLPDYTGVCTEPTEFFSSHYAVAVPQYPRVAAYPVESLASTGYSERYAAWQADQKSLRTHPNGYADSLHTYFKDTLPLLLSGNRNTVCSPVSIYMALAMLAETTDGSSRQQILSLLGADSIESLRTQAQYVWKAHYNDDGLSTSILGTSLWLKDNYTYNEDTAQLLADHYYASVFRGNLGSEEINAALQSWLNEQTGGLLQEQAGNAKLVPNSVLALATTVFYQTQWQTPFLEKNNSQGLFHGNNADTEVTFMNQRITSSSYYWGEDFSAVYQSLEGGSKMWLILPDPGLTPEDLLESSSAMEFVLSDSVNRETPYPNQKYLTINLSVPKFDVSDEKELKQSLEQLGVTDIFTPETADFSPIIPIEDGGAVCQFHHAVRVAIHEEGVAAAAYTLVDRYGNGIAPDDEIDFILDRPFLFVITSRDNLPLFAGVVNQL